LNTNSQYELSIVLPTYNESGNILLLLEELKKNLSIPYEAIVVDDNSPDGTWQMVADYAKSNTEVKLIHRVNERGLTSAINAGIDAATGQLVMWMDVDLSMPPNRIPALLAAINSGADVAVGSRYVAGGGDARAVTPLLSFQLLLSKILSILGGWFLGCSFRDWSSGFIVLKREALSHYRLTGDYGEYFIGLIYYLIKVKKLSVVEIPYILTPRERGESKTATNVWGFFRRGRKYLQTLWRVKFAAV
jgi:dolichol-phosphate mannosyltransferase